MFKKSFTAIAFAFLSLNVSADTIPAYPFIHANGEAFTFVSPNLGEVDFEISAFDPSPEAAVSLVQQRVEELMQLLKDQGVPEGDFEFSDLRREMRKGADPASPEYDVKCAVHINVRDLAKWRAVMEPLMSKPNIDAFATKFGTTERAKVEAELMSLAVQDAQNKAKAMASGFGKKVGAVTGVSSGQLKNITRSLGLVPGDVYYEKGKRPPQDRSELLMVTALKLSQSVDIIFRIK